MQFGNALKREESYPHISQIMGNHRTRATIISTARIDLLANLPCGTPWHKVPYCIRPANSSPTMRISENTVIMSSSKENQPVHATSTS